MRSNGESRQIADSFSSQVVPIYLRNRKGEARLASLTTPISSSELLLSASTRCSIPKDRLVLYYNGLRVDAYGTLINLIEFSICHVIDLAHVNTPELTVSFKPDWGGVEFKIAFLPETLIKETLNGLIAPRCELPEDRIFLVHVGKTLNPSNNWK